MAGLLGGFEALGRCVRLDYVRLEFAARGAVRDVRSSARSVDAALLRVKLAPMLQRNAF
jgi:hypothetical protein